MIPDGRGVVATIRHLRAIWGLVRRVPGLVDPDFYVAHNCLERLSERSRSLRLAHFLAIGQWRDLDPSAAFSTSYARERLERACVRRRGSVWSTFLLRRASSRVRSHPLQVPETEGLWLAEPSAPVLARLAAGMSSSDARSEIHPLLPDRTTFAPDVSALYEEITGARVRGTRPPERTVEVLFVNGDQHCPACTQYRVLNPLATLRAGGVDAYAVDADDLHNLAGTRLRAKVVVVFRALWSADLADALERFRADGATLLFDADDLLFDGPRVLTSLQPGVSPEERLDERPGSQAGRESMRRVAALCDAASFPTDELAAAWRLTPGGTPAVTLPSFLSAEQIRAASRVAEDVERPNGHVIIGYSSGSATHGGDFATAAPALASVLAEHPDVELRVFGPVGIEDFPALRPFARRVSHERSLTRRWDLLARRMAGCDLNIVPLELDNGYCRCKSEVKYVEAGSVGVSTIAAAIPAYRRAIGEAGTGVLVERATEWPDRLEGLVRNGTLRSRLGQSAIEDVRSRYSERGRFGQRYLEWMRGLVAGGPLPDTRASSSLERIHAPRVESLHEQEPALLVAVGLAHDPETLRSAIADRWPDARIRVAAETPELTGLAEYYGSRPWRPGDSEVDLATTLRSSQALVAVGEPTQLLTRARACQLDVWKAEGHLLARGDVS